MANTTRKVAICRVWSFSISQAASWQHTQTREGYVYKIDTRLRPSGNAGPLVTSLESFREYHGREAQIWERQALTKARVVLAGTTLKEDIEEVCRTAVYGSSADAAARAEINRLRTRMEVAPPPFPSTNFVISPGASVPTS